MDALKRLGKPVWLDDLRRFLRPEAPLDFANITLKAPYRSCESGTVLAQAFRLGWARAQSRRRDLQVRPRRVVGPGDVRMYGRELPSRALIGIDLQQQRWTVFELVE